MLAGDEVNDADRNVLRFQDRPLFDVKLKVSFDFGPTFMRFEDAFGREFCSAQGPP